MELTVNLLGFENYKAVSFDSMDGYDVYEVNTFDDERVKMHSNAVPTDEVVSLKPLSFNVIRYKKMA